MFVQKLSGIKLLKKDDFDVSKTNSNKITFLWQGNNHQNNQSSGEKIISFLPNESIKVLILTQTLSFIGIMMESKKLSPKEDKNPQA